MPSKNSENEVPKSETEGYRPPSHYGLFSPRDEVGDLREMPAEIRDQQNLPFTEHDSQQLFYAGRLQLVRRVCVSVIGTRQASDEGREIASDIATRLANHGIVTVSGLAKGIDTAAHRGAIDAGGSTIAVIGTPLNQAYPKQNKRLQQEIYREHLLISPFAFNEPVEKENFPERNKVMALLSEASVIVEAGETSGTIHQAKACKDHRRWLLFHAEMARPDGPDWVKSFLRDYPRALIFRSIDDILAVATE